MVIGQTQTSPSELLAKNAVLFLEVIDHILLMAVDPTGEHQQEKLKRWRNCFHIDRFYLIRRISASLLKSVSSPLMEL